MKPKYTDGHKYPHGYKQAVDTDIAATFKRIRTEQQRNEKEAEAKVEQLKPRLKARTA